MEGLAVPAKAAPQPIGTSEGEIKGNSKGYIYHLPTCPNYGKVSERNVVTFKTKEEAVKAGDRKVVPEPRPPQLP